MGCGVFSHRPISKGYFSLENPKDFSSRVGQAIAYTPC
ncbi:MAG: hypothetical protein ACI8ZX_002467, partial [Planctomycetota bacterium]